MPESEALPFPDDSAAAVALERIGAIDVELARIEAKKSRNVARVAAAAERQATPLTEKRAGLAGQLEAYCNLERKRLTDEFRRKTAPFTTGECGWRDGRGRVVMDPALKKPILAALAKLAGLTRTKIEPDITAIGKAFRDDPKSKVHKILGLTYEIGAEDFWLKPTGAELVARP